MNKKIIGILVCTLLFSIAILPATGSPISELKKFDVPLEETTVNVFYIVKIDLSGKGEANHYSPSVLWKLTEGTVTTSSVLYFVLSEEDIISRHFFESYEITSPASGMFLFFRGTVDYDPESGTVEIHGSAVMALSGPMTE